MENLDPSENLALQNHKMKILLTADPFIPVPPEQYGGIERVIHMLIDGYAEHGHEVFLLAHKDSYHAKLTGRFDWPHEQPKGIKHLENALTLRKVVKDIEPDVIHSFNRLQYLLAIRWATTAFILQCYQRKISVATTSIASRIFPKSRLQFSACGAHMLNPEWPHFHRWHVVHNCTDTDRLTPLEGQGQEHFVFLGRIEPIKGVVEAITLAKKTGITLKIAGNIEPEHQSFFDQRVLPHIDGEFIQYLGPVDDSQKHALFAGAKAFLMLIQWEEPFGIVMAEALSCGVPIIALDRGSVPEIVRNGVNGFMGRTIDELIKSIAALDTISNEDCRLDALNRFSVPAITAQYLDILNKEKSA